MLNKVQKRQQIDLGLAKIKKSRCLVFLDFSGVTVEELKKLKTELRKAGATFQVIKKRLLKLAMKEAGFDFDPLQFDLQVGTIFVPEDLTSVAAAIYKSWKEISKTKKNFKILGVYNLAEKSFLAPEEFVTIAKLPGREALLGMLVSVLAGPIRAFMYVLQERSKKVAEVK